MIRPAHVLGTCRGSPEGLTELGYDGALTSAARRPAKQMGLEMSLHGAARGTPHKRGWAFRRDSEWAGCGAEKEPFQGRALKSSDFFLWVEAETPSPGIGHWILRTMGDL